MWLSPAAMSVKWPRLGLTVSSKAIFAVFIYLAASVLFGSNKTHQVHQLAALTQHQPEHIACIQGQ